MIQLTEAEHAALLADAARYRGLRLVLTEPDETKHEAMCLALDACVPSTHADGHTMTAAEADEAFDNMLKAINEARNANNQAAA